MRLQPFHILTISWNVIEYQNILCLESSDQRCKQPVLFGQKGRASLVKQREKRIKFGVINRYPMYATLLQLAQTSDSNHEKLMQIIRRNRHKSQALS